MSEEPEGEETQPTSTVVPFEEPQAVEKAVPATSVLRLPMGKKGPQLLTIDDALKYATACHRSGLLPEHIKTPQQAYVIMDNGRELGLGPWAAWKLIYITKQGRIAIMSKGALAVVQACAAYESYTERIEFEGTEEMTAVAVARRKGRPAIEKRFSMADAAAADLLSKKKNRRGEEYDGPWQSFVKDMLLARARDRALSVAFAAELAGIEPETIAEDADRLEAKASGGPAATVVAPREPEDGALAAEAPKQLPSGKPDPLLAFVLKGQKAPDTEKAAAAAVVQKDQGGPPAPIPPQAQVASRAEIDVTVDEALPPPKKAKAKKDTRGYEPGALMHPNDPKAVRRVLEVDEDGRPTVVEKLTATEIADLFAKKEVPATPSSGIQKNCPRDNCGKPLNLLGDCDACGWPNAHYE